MHRFGNRFGIELFAIIVVLIITFGCKAALAQGSSQSAATPGAPAGSYKLSEFDSVNLFSGNLNFNLPLAGLKGRGDLSSGVSLTIEQQWSISEVSDYHWSIRNQISPLINAVGQVRINGHIRQTSELCLGWPFPSTYWTKHQLYLTFVEQDGTEVPLVDATYKGLEKTICGFTPMNYGTTFSSADGGSVTFVSDSNITGTDDGTVVAYGATGYLYKSGGSKSRVENGEILWTKDRNGNLTEYEYDSEFGFPDSYPRLTLIKDSVGREIEIEYGVTESSPYGLCNRITYKGFGGVERIIRVSLDDPIRSPVSGTDDDYALYSMITTDPNDSPQITGTIFDWSQSPKAVWLPDGRSYQFTYNVNGRLAKVVLPTGGYVEYDFYKTLGGEYFQWDYFRNEVKERRIYDENNNLQQKTTFVYDKGTYGSFGTRTTVSRFDNGNNLVEKSRHYFIGQANTTESGWWSPTAGKEGKTELLALDSSTILRTIETEWSSLISPACYHDVPTTNPCSLSPYPQVPNTKAVVASTKTTFEDTNQVSLVSARNPSTNALAFDLYGNQTDAWYYDYGSGSPGSFLKREHTDFVTSSNYLDRYLRSLPSQTWVSSDSAGSNKVSLSVLEYDNYASNSTHAGLVSRSSVTGHDSTNYGTGLTYRGNVTAATSYANAAAQTGAVNVYSQYDILGNVVKTIDANSNATTISYNDNFGSPDSYATTNSTPSQISGLSTFAFPTSSTNPMNWTSYVQYDYFTGAPVNTQDINGLISKTIYDDDLDRPTQTVSSIGTANEIQTTIEYDDANRKVQKTSDLNTLNDNLIKTESFYDGLGRTTETRSYEADGNYRAVQTQYDALGRPYKQSNPFRPTEIDGGHPILWTESRFDSLGRVYEVETPDGAKVKSAFDGNRVLVTDQAGRQRISRTNALGQLKDVWEVKNSDADTESISFPSQSLSAGYKTSYSYDTLNNLTTVSQGSQTRTFTYDNLSRLLSAANPESGTISYTYDSNSNLQAKRDARNIKTVYDYDVLNRVTKRCYRSIGTGSLGLTTCTGNTETAEANTPDVTYTFEDTNVTNLKRVLTKVTNGTSTTEYTSFDILGRVTAAKQTTDGQAYTTGYVYDLSGALVEEAYPSGRVVKNVLDANGDLSIVESKKNQTAGFFGYAKNFTYNASGAVTSMQLGNGRWESTTFNNRLQPTQIALGTLESGTDKLKLNYTYDNGTASTNNGNVMSQTVTVPTVGQNTGFAAVQTYNYDALNRLKDATENITPNGGSQTQSWKQTFTFDRYGNRRFDEANTTTIPQGCQTVVCNPTIDPATNKLVGYVFDTSGNTTTDANNQTFIYDAENKQVEVRNAASQTVGEYFYDGDGKRIKKAVPSTGETTVFVYDAAGKLVAEYSTIITSPQDAKVSYLTNDTLGSPRITTDQNGQTISRRDFMPFGEEIDGTGGRTTSLGYVADTVRQKFTGYERDNESELDFAEARYYNPMHGRFTTVDPLAASASQSDPQTFNRYVYVRNSPLVMTDPTGMMGDYFSYNGTYLGNDGKDDQKVYFATEIGRNGNNVDLDRRTIRQTTLDEVLKARDRAVAITPGTDNTIQELAQNVNQGVSDGFTGIAKGVGNAPAVALNGATGCIFNCGVQGAYFQGSNPLEVPLIFPYNNAREASYGSASSTGTLLGLGVAGAAVAPSAAAPSVVPAAPSRGAGLVTEWLGPGAQPVRSGSDLMIRSADGTKTIRFDLVNSHGDLPHINVQTWQNTVRGWRQTTPNTHIYPK